MGAIGTRPFAIIEIEITFDLTPHWVAELPKKETFMTSCFTNALIEHTPLANRGDIEALELVLTRDAFAEATSAICAWSGYEKTPLHNLASLAGEAGVGQLFYKDESSRFGLGSFKALGGAYAAQQLLRRVLAERLGVKVSLEDVRSGKYKNEVANIHIVTATDGNHGRSVSWGCQSFGAPCHIYIHAEVSEGRAEAMRAYGADVVRVDGNYDVSVHEAQNAADSNGWFVVSDTSYPGYTLVPSQVMAGYGAMSAEIVEELGDNVPTHLFVQGGVGGMAAGLSASLYHAWGARMPRVVVVEPNLADCLFLSAQAGELTEINIETETVMAGLSCGKPSLLAWEILASISTDFLRIPEAIVGPTMLRLAKPTGGDVAIIAGESAVAGLACVLAAAKQPELKAILGLDTSSRVLLIGSEGATDETIYAEMIAAAQVA